ncbi:hypothetical protein [Rhodococcus tukisamuensis]|uniref:Excreted virulence factor EspC, type VII ESX diderm n=1 Tax=Rhodococcus tukisamuensis TaxID=168276 RepID=A0A1G7E9B2_9NOCA|nr:hypothetical protein [Rhodococcus tukisamuensis]SDE60233.1 hypothetical protein SAMN05444580_1237 [Rhodococcus tukisamuensis]
MGEDDSGVGECLELDAAGLRTVANGLRDSATAVSAAATAIRGRGLDGLARRIQALADATSEDARRLAVTVDRYVRQDAENARLLDGGTSLGGERR